MAEPELAGVLDQNRPAQKLTSNDMGKIQSTLQTSFVATADALSGQTLIRTEEPAPQPSDKLHVPSQIVNTIEQISEKVVAQVDIVPAKGPGKGSFNQEIPLGFIMPQPVRPIFPGLMRAAETSLSKAEVRSTLSTNLAPRSGTLLSQPFRHDENTFGRLKSPQVSSPATITGSNHVIQSAQSTAASPSPAPPPPPIIHKLTSTFNVASTVVARSTTLAAPIAIMPSAAQPFPPRTPGSSGKKLQRTYVLPDGTVTTSGKGLGRGRPGIKRGPRKSKLATEIKPESPMATDDTLADDPAQKKRKRAMLDEPTDPATPSEPSSRASSEEFIPENTQTRSGRQAFKPSTFVPSSTSTPVAKRPKLSPGGPSVPKPAALAKIKRKTYRGREHAALCEHCLRGHGPAGNVIVFCDACNKCWHQRCHQPQVSEAVIKDTKAEWYCSDCEKIINGPKKGGKKATPKSKPSLSLSLAPTLPVPLVGASSLTREQREAQLSALSKDKLIEMLMRATDLAPALPLFENPNPPVVTTPITSRSTDPYPTPTQEEDDYGYLYDEHAALYPKPGNGVKLPPESADLAMLLEGPDCKTFSHTLLTPAQRGLIAASA